MCLICSHGTLLTFLICAYFIRFLVLKLSLSTMHSVMCLFAADVGTTKCVHFAQLTRCPPRVQRGACLSIDGPWAQCPGDFSNRSQFDSTRGYPGEGPADLWTLFSHNTGSLRTTMQWQSSEDSVLCIQEPRIGRNNFRDASFRVKATGRSLFSSKLLPGLITTHGVSRTPHGGSAILAPPETTQAFDPQQDITGQYQALFNTTRVTAVWHQVTKHVRALIWSFYGKTGASSEQEPHVWNDDILSKIFEISAQYGDIPVIVSGDFQAEPMSYQSIVSAIQFAKWEDPFLSYDADGLPSRDLTFSSDRSFSGQEGCSSIDSILINHVTSAALVRVETVPTFETQHRPLRITCSWPKIFISGFVHNKTAPLNFASDKKDLDCAQFTSQHAETLWTNSFAQAFDQADDVDRQWHIANDFCVSFLLQNGAFWGKGLKERGTPPKFRSKKVCPGQSLFGGSSKSRMSRLCRAYRGLQELCLRLSRAQRGFVDTQVTFNTCCKIRRLLVELKAPAVWESGSFPSLLQVWMNLSWVGDAARTFDVKIKLARIQAWKSKIQEDARSDKKFIFKHLRNRACEEPANLLQDPDGNIITDPNQAIRTFNEAWDDVFACNIQADHPLKMLDIIWPYIRDHELRFECQPIDAQCLWHIVQSRNPQAAPGLDGWRTGELQLMPAECFRPFATVFAALAVSDDPLPPTLTCARQMILNKNGSSHPMQKRLITVLPILYLAYSGARFRQLRGWQINSMPSQLVGGVQGRNMSSIQTQMKLDIDIASAQGFDLIGMKLDKAKCFDRVIPSFASCLMLAFGIDKKIVTIFSKLYDGLHRHLSYKSWCSPTATHAANGIAQGDSFSLVAINVYSKVWIVFMDLLPEVVAMAYIDDAYLWARLEHASKLAHAVEITRFWDLLSGQLLNDSKCVVWGTSTKARKVCKQLWPNMSLQLEVEVLGAFVTTSKRLAFHFEDLKTQAIVKEIKHIRALPIPVNVKAFFLGVKVIPRFCYTASLNQIPKEVSKKFQSEIVQTLWGRRPHWRSRALVMTFLSEPHRNDPVCALAYHAVMDFLRFLRMPGNGRDKCLWAAAHCTVEHALLSKIKEAFRFFGLSLSPDLVLSFGGKPLMPAWDLHPKDIKMLLHRLSRHRCYLEAANQHRKDFRMPSGILDYDLTCGLRDKSTIKHESKAVVESHFVAQLVGCTLTRDRLCAASLDTSDKCRFCGCVKESLAHLVFDCEAYHALHPPEPVHEFGSNFGLLGIVEHPVGVVKHRLQWNDPNDLLAAPFQPSAPRVSWWSDGSVFWPDVFWLSAGGFSIVNDRNQEIFGGPVHHLHITSYTTELWAVVVAIHKCAAPTEVFTDCQTIVDQFHVLQTDGAPHTTWSHFSWWHAISIRLQILLASHPDPFVVSWIPSHLYEHLPECFITQAMANAKKTEVRHIIGNRFADKFAKEHAVQATSVHPSDEQMLKQSIVRRQDWLTMLNLEIAALQKSDQESKQEARLAEEEASEDVFALFPHWEWEPQVQQFPWTPTFVFLPDKFPPQWASKSNDWKILGSFFACQQWRLAEDAVTSYVELAVLFHLQGFRLPSQDTSLHTFRDLTAEIRQFVASIRVDSGISFVPGCHNRHRNKSIGKSLPNGTIDGAEIFISRENKIRFARILAGVSTARLQAWAFSLDSAEC